MNTTLQKKEFIEFMLDAGVLRFGDFTTRSGRRTPYFINAGNYKTGGQTAKLGTYYAAAIMETVGAEFDALFGPAYKGIPLAVSTAATLASAHGVDKPYFFNRKEVKDHGEGGLLVGYTPGNGDRVLYIEDVITAGTVFRETLPLLKSIADVRVEHMFISADRCEVGTTPGKTAVMEVYEQFGVRVHSIVNVVDIREYLASREDYAALLPQMDRYMAQYCVL